MSIQMDSGDQKVEREIRVSASLELRLLQFRDAAFLVGRPSELNRKDRLNREVDPVALVWRQHLLGQRLGHHARDVAVRW